MSKKNKKDETSKLVHAPATGTSFIAAVLGENPIAKNGGNPYAQYLSRSILLEEASPPKNVQATINIIFVLIMGFLVLASIIRLDERAVGFGTILPVGFEQPVQHLEGGIISRILVAEGQYVEEGEPLILMDRTASASELGSLSARHMSLSLEIERLSAFVDTRQPDFSFAGEEYTTLVADQQRIYEGQMRSRNAQVAVIESQVSDLREERAGLEEQVSALEKELGFITEEVNLRQQLLEQGLTSRLLYLSAQRELSRTEGRLAETRAEMASVSIEITEAQQRITEIDERLKNDALNRMGIAVTERAQVAETLNRLRDRVRRTSIVAPVDGRVKGIVRKTTGGVIAAGETLMEIVPSDDELIAEIRIDPKDIGHIEAGQPALVRVETYNFSRFGGIEGIVDRVSASSFTDEEGNVFFRVFIRLNQNYVGDIPGRNPLAPGMTLTADVQTGDKTLMQYLLRPIARTISDSLGER